MFAKKSNLAFSYSSMLYKEWKDFVFASWIPGGEIYFIRNKSCSFVTYIVEWYYGVRKIEEAQFLIVTPLN